MKSNQKKIKGWGLARSRHDVLDWFKNILHGEFRRLLSGRLLDIEIHTCILCWEGALELFQLFIRILVNRLILQVFVSYVSSHHTNPPTSSTLIVNLLRYILRHWTIAISNFLSVQPSICKDIDT